MKIPYTKAHGAQNDFLLSWDSEVSTNRLPEIAKAICHRHTGVGADGWLVVSEGNDAYDGAIRLFNPDGSEPEISGNGTRCAAAFLMRAGGQDPEIRIMTGAGLKTMRLLQTSGLEYLFEMDMGEPVVEADDLRRVLTTSRCEVIATILYVGNPQCAVFVDSFNFDWQALGAELESHPHFPNRTNVSFVRVVDRHTIDVRFFERGVGVTLSSGTGSTGAAVAAILRGEVESPVRILTSGTPLDLRWPAGGTPQLTGPAEIVAAGEFYFEEN